MQKSCVFTQKQRKGWSHRLSFYVTFCPQLIFFKMNGNWSYKTTFSDIQKTELFSAKMSGHGHINLNFHQLFFSVIGNDRLIFFFADSFCILLYLGPYFTKLGEFFYTYEPTTFYSLFRKKLYLKTCI